MASCIGLLALTWSYCVIQAFKCYFWKCSPITEKLSLNYDDYYLYILYMSGCVCLYIVLFSRFRTHAHTSFELCVNIWQWCLMGVKLWFCARKLFNKYTSYFSNFQSKISHFIISSISFSLSVFIDISHMNVHKHYSLNTSMQRKNSSHMNAS